MTLPGETVKRQKQMEKHRRHGHSARAFVLLGGYLEYEKKERCSAITTADSDLKDEEKGINCKKEALKNGVLRNVCANHGVYYQRATMSLSVLQPRCTPGSNPTHPHVTHVLLTRYAESIQVSSLDQPRRRQRALCIHRTHSMQHESF
jgi:hypothetical protein